MNIVKMLTALIFATEWKGHLMKKIHNGRNLVMLSKFEVILLIILPDFPRP